MLIAEFQDKQILILGFGREGQDSFLFLREKFPEKSIGIADKKEFEELSPEAKLLLNKDRKVVLYVGDSYLKQLNKYDVVIKSPGIPLGALKPYLKKNQILTSQTNIFFANCPGTIVGVTGTKGKSTTASLIYHVLQGGPKVHLIGNIGEPALQFLAGAGKDDVFVYELSSFQLEIATQSPHVAVFLNLYPEHLDHHGSFEAYAKAKAHITKFQTEKDYLIYNEDDEEVSRIAVASKAQKLAFTPHVSRAKGAGFAASVQPAYLVAKLFSIPKEKVEKALKAFKPLPHRLELVGTHHGIVFYNDSLATIPEATIAALDILGNKVATLIVGGYDRGIQFPKLAERILHSGVRNLILFPITGELVLKEIEVLRKDRSLPKCFHVQNMAEAVELSYQYTPKGRICLLSPAASSFNLFRDYKHRGEEFKNWITHYGKKKRA
ncbi:MAG TPA: UDP-N-acetylmuramoyl-L-alanine--D-glutamate ligase [Candidatus Paceibacterota bacterium]